MHAVRSRRSADDFPRAEHLAAKIADVAAGPVGVGPEAELAGDVVELAERERFLAAVDSLADLRAGELGALNVVVAPRVSAGGPVIPAGIFGD
jgi:hypothetical protein